MTRNLADRRAAFRALHKEGCFVLPNPWDVGSARLLQHMGFVALASSSAGFAWTTGRPDYAVSRDDVLQHLTVLCEAVDLPVNADFESGFATGPDELAANVGRVIKTGVAGFSNPDDAGNWSGIDVDLCRAVAAAVFGDAGAVKFTPLTAKERFTALQSGEIDVLSRNTTWTLSRDTSLGANFTGVTYYDGQGFLVKKSLQVKSALELNSASVCV